MWLSSQSAKKLRMNELKGLDKELYEKHMAKYDPEREAQAVEYVEAVSGLKLDDRSDVQGSLKSGNVLGTMLNNILEARAAAGQTDVKPVKLTTSKFPFKQMEVIGQYLDRISKLGVLSQESFQTVDLYEGKNMLQVIDSIFALSRHVHQYGYPLLGPKLATKNERTFTEEQLAASKGAVPLLAKWSSPSGSTPAQGSIRQVYNPNLPVGDTSAVTKLMGGLLIEKGRDAPLKPSFGSKREIGGNYVDTPSSSSSSPKHEKKPTVSIKEPAQEDPVLHAAPAKPVVDIVSLPSSVQGSLASPSTPKMCSRSPLAESLDPTNEHALKSVLKSPMNVTATPAPSPMMASSDMPGSTLQCSEDEEDDETEEVVVIDDEDDDENIYSSYYDSEEAEEGDVLGSEVFSNEEGSGADGNGGSLSPSESFESVEAVKESVLATRREE